MCFLLLLVCFLFEAGLLGVVRVTAVVCRSGNYSSCSSDVLITGLNPYWSMYMQVHLISHCN